MVSTSFILTIAFSSICLIMFFTRNSGAEAPEEIPIFLHSKISLIGNFFSSSISSDLLQPDFLATSTSLNELEEFLLPITYPHYFLFCSHLCKDHKKI